MIRFLACLIAILVSTAPASAQRGPSTDKTTRLLTAIAGKCLLVTPELAKEFAELQLGQCETNCRGCGCKAGPGFRALSRLGERKLQCVGFQNANSVCGPPPHAKCKKECNAIKLDCIGHGRAKLLLLQKRLKNPLIWITKGSNEPVVIEIEDDDADDMAPPPELAPAGLSTPRQ